MSQRSDHWLWRLDARQWQAAAERERDLACDAKVARRRCLTHVRRSAGMALNAVLIDCFGEDEAEQVWGRSYVEHLRAVAGSAPLPESVKNTDELERWRASARHIVETPLLPRSNPGLTQLAGARPASEPDASLQQLDELLSLCRRARPQQTD